MKISSYAFCLLSITAVFANCDKARVMPRRSWGYFEARMNKNEWQNSFENAYQRTNIFWGTIMQDDSTSCESKVTYLVSSIYTTEGYLRYEFYLTKVPLEKGRYKVGNVFPRNCTGPPIDAVLYTLTSDGDVGEDTYRVLESHDNYLEVSEYLPSTQEIKGKFQITMVLDDIAFGHHLPDTLRFTEGKFHTKFVNP